MHVFHISFIIYKTSSHKSFPFASNLLDIYVCFHARLAAGTGSMEVDLGA